mmetsp:Transcript_1432/g.3655  ORF Transcript_1432/g.3655 Transcript_1432/m.3655 type:complete len:502 (-) Transcript_1432:756-2261(-)|eukprot:CAMPEP_0172357920 /NCGR_PEP_ID=MMETSP1060-20121228/2264_1 /TAXON_ID=37318 /ORGANISM="Pseudo-nitzschia pungens, Strain cf. cingulata" /LENGTH=501 /DNA_ID=CAMNT_0013078857 /DNA_START=185 /DNA_END=1690 /DNA_ORIENTATION=-
MSRSEANRQLANSLSSSSNPSTCHPYEDPDPSTTNREPKTLMNGVLTELYATDPSMNELVQRIVTEIAFQTARSVAKSASASDESSKKSKKDRGSGRSKSKSKSSRKNRSKSIRNGGSSSKVESTVSNTQVSSKKTKKQKSKEKEKEPQAATDSASSLLSSSPGSCPESILRNRNRSSSISDSFSNLSGTSSLNSMSQKTITCALDSRKFYHELIQKLEPHRETICIQDVDELLLSDTKQEGGWMDSTNTTENLNRSDHSLPTLLTAPSTKASSCFSMSSSSSRSTTTTNRVGGGDFEAAFEPFHMRCLALVSHNEMKTTMKQFVISYKHILKKFRLTGTQSTMTMLGEVFDSDPDIVFGPTCKSGPLGGDAELVAMMTSGQLGGLLFFQDPMTSHPHQCDIDCLVRQAQVNNTVIATTPTTALAIVELFKMALMGSGKPELIPSFFLTTQSPTVLAYQRAQEELVMSKRMDTNKVSSIALQSMESDSSTTSTIGLSMPGF